MPKLLMLKGLPASGKSTYAKELIAKDLCWKRVNKDDLRAMIDNGKWSKKNEELIIDSEASLVHSFLDTGYNVVIDDTNFAHEKRWEGIANAHGAGFEIKFFDTPVMECIARDAKRGDKSVGSKVIMGMYERYLKPKLLEHSNTLSDCYIFDIDGTLAKMDGRSPYDYTKVDTDIPNRDVVGLYKFLSHGNVELVIVSGRESSCFFETSNWLRKNGISYTALHMRSSGDHRDDRIIKKEIYEKHIQGKYNVLGVFDDRDRVVEMWRSLGLTCFQVDYGSF